MFAWTEAFYKQSPIAIQTMLINLYAYKLHRQRFGEKFEYILNMLEEIERWSAEDIKAYQEERLRVIVRHAFESVPFYMDKYNSLGLVPEDIVTLEDLQKLPIITKDEIRKNSNKMISFRYKKNQLVHGHTSGTTGSPLGLVWDLGMVIMNNAVDWRQKKWAGFHLGAKHAVLLGRVTVPVGQKRPPYWRMNYVHNQLWLSAFHLSEKNIPYYIEKLEKFEPKFIEGYPSTLYILARYLNAKNIVMPLNATFTSSETLFQYQKEAIENAFVCKNYDFYGLAERVVFATECNEHNGKHLNSDYSIVEFVDGDGKNLEKGQLGRMVGTSLHNMGMPLIRYMTNDVCALLDKSCTCGCKYPLIDDVTTKQEDTVITPDGRWISSSTLTHPFKLIKNIIESQIIQEELTHLTISIVCGPKYSQKDTDLLLKGLVERLGDAIQISFVFVDSIPREKSGKFRWVISNVYKKINKNKI